MGSTVMEPDDLISYAKIYLHGENITSFCVSTEYVESRGLYYNENLFSFSVPLLLAQLSLACIVILIITSLLKPLGQPSMVIQILGGLLIGPSCLGSISGFTALLFPYKSLIVLDTLSVLGYMLYFFLIGVQMDPWILKRIQKRDIIVGVSTVSFAMFVTILGGLILEKSNPDLDPDIVSSIPGVATASSMLGFPIVAHYVTELKMVNSEFGRMALSSSLASHSFGLCVIFVLVLSGQHSVEKWQIVQCGVSGLGLTLVIIFVFRPIIVWVLHRTPEGEPLKQSFVLMVIVGVFLTGCCCKALGLNVFFGPLVYGMAIPAGPPLGSALMEKLDIVTHWLFMPLYFAKSGLVIDVFSVKLRNYLLMQSIIVLGWIGKFFGALISSIYNGVPLREAIQLGLVMNVQGVLELCIFKMLKQSKALHDEPFAVMCVSTLIVTSSVTPILNYLYDPLRRHKICKKRSIMDLKPNSELRMVVCVHDQENVPTIINFIDALNPTKHTPICICLVHFVELVGRAYSILIPHKLNKVKSGRASTSKSIVNAFKHFQLSSYDAITVHPFTAISPYEAMHDEVCEMAIDRRASLIIIPFHRRLATTGRVESSNAGIKIMNDQILEMAPCTTAIIVDRGSNTTPSPDSEVSPLYNVAVVFVGGPDDREALAIGARMVGQPNVSLTILRIVHNNFGREISEETILDNEVILEMKSKMSENQRVVFVEEKVRDGTGTVVLLRSIEKMFELIIVGRNHDTRSPIIFGLSDWTEDSELGTLGDMFTLDDSDSTSTILVVHQHFRLGGWSQNVDEYEANVLRSGFEGSVAPMRRSFAVE
ncbi:hypothetical protein ACJIZ3_015180 [Penstemon smallii]|uniref:Cation/H+ exchanger domain-containing protein n=1 Tax=Penstemon smallii TaxID=265156 RepID=A0ABD3RLQ6_9LAMI